MRLRELREHFQRVGSALAAPLSTSCNKLTNACFFSEKPASLPTELDGTGDKWEAIKVKECSQTARNSAHMAVKDVESGAALADAVRGTFGI